MKIAKRIKEKKRKMILRGIKKHIETVKTEN